MPFLPFSHGQLPMMKSLKGQKETKSREKRIQPTAGPSESMENKHHLCEALDISEKETQDEDLDQKPLTKEEDLVAENYDLKQKLFL